MKTLTTFERLNPTTADGHIIKVTTCYSSYNKEEIDELQKLLIRFIGSGIVSESYTTVIADIWQKS